MTGLAYYLEATAFFKGIERSKYPSLSGFPKDGGRLNFAPLLRRFHLRQLHAMRNRPYRRPLNIKTYKMLQKQYRKNRLQNKDK